MRLRGQRTASMSDNEEKKKRKEKKEGRKEFSFCVFRQGEKITLIFQKNIFHSKLKTEKKINSLFLIN
jgi:hypothetical protein